MQRNFERLSVSLPVEFSGPEGPVQGKTTNLSQGGMFIETKKQLPKGAKVFFDFRGTNSHLTLHVEGEVMWLRKRARSRGETPYAGGMGIRFVQNRAQTGAALENIFSMLMGTEALPKAS